MRVRIFKLNLNGHQYSEFCSVGSESSCQPQPPSCRVSTYKVHSWCGCFMNKFYLKLSHRLKSISGTLIIIIIVKNNNLEVGYESNDRATLPRRNLLCQNIYFSFPEALRAVIIYFFTLSSANSIINNCQ